MQYGLTNKISAGPNKSIKMKILFAIAVFFILHGCKSQNTTFTFEKELVFENISDDTTVVFYGIKGDTLNIFRKIEVIENFNTDTVTLGFAIIPPGFSGNIFFIQDGLDKSKGVYIEKGAVLDPTLKLSYAKLFTISLWNKKPSNKIKKLIIKVLLKTSAE